MVMRSSNFTPDSKDNTEEPVKITFVVSNRYSGYLLIEVGGSIDTYSKNYFKETLCRVIKNGNIRIIIDLEKVFFISGTGVGTFVYLQRSVNKKGGDLVLTGLNHQVMDIFQILGITDVFKIVLKNKLSGFLFKPDNNNHYPSGKECPSCGSNIDSAAGSTVCSVCRSVIRIDRMESSSEQEIVL